MRVTCNRRYGHRLISIRPAVVDGTERLVEFKIKEWWDKTSPTVNITLTGPIYNPDRGSHDEQMFNIVRHIPPPGGMGMRVLKNRYGSR